MRIIYTDENRKLKVLGELVNSKEFSMFLEANLKSMQKYSYGSMRVENGLARNVLNNFLESKGLFISEKVEHANGIGNNNAYYVQDLDSKEYIGCMHLNTDMYGGLFCYVTDINHNAVSNEYFLRGNTVQVGNKHTGNWKMYSFAEEEKMLEAIDEAISLGVLEEGEHGGVMICHVFHGVEAWEEDTKEDAAKSLVETEQEYLLLDAIRKQKEQNRKMMEEVFERYQKSYVDEFLPGNDLVTGKEIWEERVVVHLKDAYSDSTWNHYIFVDENDELQIQTEFGSNLYDYAEEYGWSEEDVYKMKHGHVPYQKCEKGVLLEYKGILFDEWTVGKTDGKESVWAEMCECCAGKYKDLLDEELDDGAMGACSVKCCENVGTDMDREHHYYVDFKPELVRFIKEETAQKGFSLGICKN